MSASTGVAPTSRRRRTILVAILVVALLLLGSCVGVALTHGGTKHGGVTITGTVKALGCGPGMVEVAARPIIVTRSNVGSPKPIQHNPSTTVPTVTHPVTTSPVPTITPSSSTAPARNPSSSPSSSPSPSPSSSLRTTILEPSISPAAYMMPLAGSRPTVHGPARSGTYRLTGLYRGQPYQLGAKVDGCPSGKVDVPNAGIFIAGVTPPPNLGVIAPPEVHPPSTPGGDVPWSVGPGLSGASFQVSAGDAPATCTQEPKGLIASGALTGSSGTLHLDNAAFRAAVTAQHSGALVAGVPYHGLLHLRVLPAVAKGDPCAPSASIDVPIELSGLPQTGATQLQVYDRNELVTYDYGNCDVCQSGPYDPNYWTTSSGVDWLDPTESTRPFDWSSTAPGTTSGVWQLSSTVLPDSCTPAGVIASGKAAWASGPLTKDTVTSPPLFSIDVHAFAGQLNTATTYYVRIVPTNAHGTCTGPASSAVTLTYKKTPPPGCLCLPQPNPPPKLASVHTLITSFQPLTGPSANPPYCFQALENHTVTTKIFEFDHDIIGWVALGSGGSVGKGEEVCIAPQSNDDHSFWDDLVSIADVVLDIISFPAKVYDLYEQIIPGILGELIPGCGAACKSDLLVAEKVALTAVGLPPSLPDASRLVNDGEDYLVEQAGEASPLPPEVIKAAYNAGKSAMISQLAAASTAETGFSCDWCAFDNGVRAPSVNVLVFRDANDDPSLPLPASVCVDNSASVATEVSKYYLANPLYYGTCAAMPKSFPPGSVIIIPLALTANTADIRWQIYGDFQAQNSQLVESDGDLDLLAFESWQGQQQHTPIVGMTSQAVTEYDAGQGFGTRQAVTGTYTATFAD